jgi:hypothetical protein
MTSPVRIIPAVLSAAIVLVGFGYVAVGRAPVTDAPASREAPVLVNEATQGDIAEVRVVGPRSRPHSVRNKG